MKIGIIGNGVVGNATAQAFIGHVDEVRCYDSNPLRCTSTLHETLNSDLIFVCLPTPQKVCSLECDTSILDEFFGSYCRHSATNFVLRSTVPIGYTRSVVDRFNVNNLVHSPEFLTARTAIEDAANPTRLLIGNPDGETNSCTFNLAHVYKTVFYRPRTNSFMPEHDAPIYYMTSDESEAVKLFQNSFSAVKIAFFNEIRCLADKLGLDWDRCLQALLVGGWINPMHTQVPGPDGRRGYGGSCLPKDIANLLSCLQDVECDSWIVEAAIDRNEVDRR